MNDRPKVAGALAWYLLAILAGGFAFVAAYVAVQALTEWAPFSDSRGAP